MWPTDEMSIDRALRRLLRAFSEAKIDKENTANRIPSFLGGTIAYWRTRQSKVEIVFASKNLLWGEIECVIDMRGFAQSTLALFSDDTEAIEALVEVLEYLRHSVSMLLLDTSQGLQERGIYLLQQKLSGKDKRGMKKVISFFLRPQALAVEQRRKELGKQLRAQQERRGGSDAKHDWTEQDRTCLRKRYDELQPIWQEAKRIVRTAQKSRERTRKAAWREEVLRAYPALPLDLLERLASPRSADAKPSDIAIIHAKRLCQIPVDYSARRLKTEAGKVKAAD